MCFSNLVMFHLGKVVQTQIVDSVGLEWDLIVYVPKFAGIPDAAGCEPHFGDHVLKDIRGSQNCWEFWRSRLEGKFLRRVLLNLLGSMRKTLPIILAP